jgi:hypothetical protein
MVRDEAIKVDKNPDKNYSDNISRILMNSVVSLIFVSQTFGALTVNGKEEEPDSLLSQRTLVLKFAAICVTLTVI